MVIAVVLGGWILVSIVLSPLIGFLLFAVGKQEQLAKRLPAENRFRTVTATGLSAKRSENLRRGLSWHHREMKRPRAG